MSYAAISDTERFFEQFATSYYGSRIQPVGTLYIDITSLQSDLESSYTRMNTYLDAINRIPIVPIGTNIKTGSYHPLLIEWNCCDTIYYKLKARHSQENAGKLPDWMEGFYRRGTQIFQDIANGYITLDTDTTNRGIGYPTIVARTGMATLYSNWDSGFYSGSDFAKQFRIKISDTSAGSNIGQAQFQYSEDDGVSYLAPNYFTGTVWCVIHSGLQIRWAAGLGTIAQLVVGDTWRIECIPVNMYHIQGNQVRSSTFRIG